MPAGVDGRAKALASLVTSFGFLLVPREGRSLLFCAAGQLTARPLARHEASGLKGSFVVDPQPRLSTHPDDEAVWWILRSEIDARAIAVTACPLPLSLAHESSVSCSERHVVPGPFGERHIAIAWA